MLPVQKEPFPLWIGCGHQSGDDDEFLCFIERSKPVIRKWFQKIDTTSAVTRLSDALNELLTADSEIRDVRWITEGE